MGTCAWSDVVETGNLNEALGITLVLRSSVQRRSDELNPFLRPRFGSRRPPSLEA
jgi:hypothetical protein